MISGEAEPFDRFAQWGRLPSRLLLFALAALLLAQARATQATWLDAWQRMFGRGAVVYALWTVVVILVLPWIF